MSGDGVVYPCVGAVVSRFKGYGAGYEGLIPPYIVLTQPQGRFSEAGFLGPRYKPFATGGNPAQSQFAVEGIVVTGALKVPQPFVSAPVAMEVVSLIPAGTVRDEAERILSEWL